MTRERSLALVSVVVALGALGVALGSEAFGGLVPCALCLLERWPYRIVVVLAVLAVVVPRRWLLWLIVATMAVSLGLAVVHVGVEQGRWPSPLPECAAPSLGSGSIAERLARMPATVAKPCDAPTFLVPGLPISMAGLNLALSLAFGCFLILSLARPARSPS
jgi:disulfide bond formation protein DsbB